MPKRRTHESAPRTKQVLIRLTPDEYLRRSIDAREAGLSVSGLCERLVCEGNVEIETGRHQMMDPALFAELRRIGNNCNQIAHALNSNLPPDTMFAYRTVAGLIETLARDEMLAQQIAAALRTRKPANDSPAPQARDVFQRSVQLHPARRGQGHE
jgi:hypothetical protein